MGFVDDVNAKYIVGVIEDKLGLHDVEWSKLAGADIQARIETALEAEAAKRRRSLEQRLYGLSERVPLAGEDVEVKALPAKEAAAVRAWQRARDRELNAKWASIKQDDEDSIYELAEETMRSKREFLIRYGLDEALVSEAADVEIEGAVEVALALLYPTIYRRSPQMQQRTLERLLAQLSELSQNAGSTRLARSAAGRMSS